MPTQIGENRAKKMLKPTRCSDGIEHRFGRDHHRQPPKHDDRQLLANSVRAIHREPGACRAAPALTLAISG